MTHLWISIPSFQRKRKSSSKQTMLSKAMKPAKLLTRKILWMLITMDLSWFPSALSSKRALKFLKIKISSFLALLTKLKSLATPSWATLILWFPQLTILWGESSSQHSSILCFLSTNTAWLDMFLETARTEWLPKWCFWFPTDLQKDNCFTLLSYPQLKTSGNILSTHWSSRQLNKEKWWRDLLTKWC